MIFVSEKSFISSFYLKLLSISLEDILASLSLNFIKFLVDFGGLEEIFKSDDDFIDYKLYYFNSLSDRTLNSLPFISIFF